jgi:Flp pilus assembly pilin Flp
MTRFLATARLSQLLTSLRREEGQTMAEYAVILAVITVGIIAAVTALSGGIQTALNNVVDVLT